MQQLRGDLRRLLLVVLQAQPQHTRTRMSSRERACLSYSQMRSRQLKQIASANRRKVLVLRRFLQTYKAKPCVDCKQKFPHYVMDFDHVRGKKLNEVSQMVSRHVSIRVLLAEIAKCDVVCANCHRERTYGP